ncbi:hypothetical protein [Lutibacter sp. B1]|uniref:DUF3885 domain-containing protein n=1 Tax=Lutibacter sp. B1 TaxID=2725996 RepID=UPI0014566518|nr:hypothetical protein [Lutibacter sp. B1]NLP59304.1 hypothetical protein [Lutibacter sp. B1]
MTKFEFIKYWNENYPNSLPIENELVGKYENRWFRIHSLPDSKRYAENEYEYNQILERQNKLITDIFGNNTDFQILIGLYQNDTMNENYEFLDYLNTFIKIMNIDLHKEKPDIYEDEMSYEIYVKQEKWNINDYNEILKKIADDEIRAIFINPQQNSLIIPYDGGVDVILKNTEERDRFKSKYADWISKREDGL